MTNKNAPPSTPVMPDTRKTLRSIERLIAAQNVTGQELSALLKDVEAIVSGHPDMLTSCPNCGHAFDAAHQDDIVRTGDLVVNLDAGLASRAGVALNLTRTEWNVLAFLARHRGRLVPSVEILTGVWSSDYRNDTQYLRVWTSRLRQKLGPGLIQTIAGRGYTLAMLPVVESDSEYPRVETRSA